MLAAMILNLGVAVLSLALGEHALADALRGAELAESRARGWELAAQVHVALGLSLIAVFAVGLARWFVVLPLGLGTAVFCGALYAYGAFEVKWAMPGTVVGAGLILVGFVLAALVAVRR
ncbi:MAG: DUF423 domain-containing protein [Pseudomonadota bacterium]